MEDPENVVEAIIIGETAQNKIGADAPNEMKLDSLLSKFRRKKQGNNDPIKSINNNKENQRKRNKIRRIINIGSPSSSARTQRTDSRSDDENDGLYHPDYVPPPSRTFPPVTPSNLFHGSKDEPAVGETSETKKEETKQQGEEAKVDEKSLHSAEAVIGEFTKSPGNLVNKRSIHNGVSSQLIWMKAALLDDNFSDDDDFIHSSEYFGKPKQAQQQEEEDSEAIEETTHTAVGDDDEGTPNTPRPNVTLTTLALDSTRASNMYRIYESDFDDFGLVTGVDVVDEVNHDLQSSAERSRSDQEDDSPHRHLMMKQVNDIVEPYDPVGDYILPRKSGVTPLRWCPQEQLPDMTLPAPPEPESDFPLDEMDEDLNQLIMEDDVSALSNDTPPPAIYRNMKGELRAQPPTLTCQPISFRRSQHPTGMGGCGDGKHRMADIFYKVFHCHSNAAANSYHRSYSFTGTTITVRIRSTSLDRDYESLHSDVTPPAAGPSSAGEHIALVYESIYDA